MGVFVSPVRRTRWLKFWLGLVFSTLLIFLNGTDVHAGTFTAFGPQNYQRSTGSPVVETASFTVLDPSTTYTLKIYNGGLEDDQTIGEFVSSSEVKINGTVVAGPSNFNQNVSTLTIPVTLQTGNTLSVELRGKPGGVITLQIIGDDNTPPVITATATPSPNPAGWNNTPVTVTFDCTDTTSGILLCPDPITIATDGAGQVVSGTATDNAGNAAFASITLAIDQAPPVISANLAPLPNASGWNNTDVTVSFTANDALSGLMQSSQPINVTTEGANQLIQGTATDIAGNSAATSATISLDKTAPAVAITSPQDGTTVPDPALTTTGTSTDALSGLAAVACNGQPATLTNDSFSCNLTLVPGPNPITVQSTDVAGNAGSSTVTVAFVPGDVIPLVSITSPANLSLFSSGPITVSGTVDDETATVVVNSIPATVSAGSFTATGVPLKEGINRITATATDPADNVGTASISVTLDTTAPIVVIDSPLDGAITTQATIDVTGIINDITTGTVNGDDVTVKVNGLAAAVSNGSFLVAGLPVKPGPNLLTATATDTAGNSAGDSVTITRQALAGQTIALVTGNNQSAPIGSPLPDPLIVQLTDRNGNPTPNRPVTFTVIRSDGTLSALPTVRTQQVLTDALGQAAVFLTLGTRTGAGNNRVKATATGFVGEVVFCASALAAPASSLKTISGENQTGVAGQLLPEPLVVFVHDAGGNPVEGMLVTFTVLQGGGSFDGEASILRTTDSDGRAAAVLTLGLQEGINNNVVNATFPGLTGLPAIFIASGFASGNAEETRVSGVVLDNSNNPIPGVTAKILGTALEAVTDDQGQFSIPGAPVGAITLEVDGTTTTLPGTWPVLDFDLTTISGQDNTIGMPIFLLPLDTVNAKVVGGPVDTTLEMAQVPGLALTVFANSVTCPDGASECLAMITQVHRDKVPMPPPKGAAPRLVWTIQPAGILFDPPARITYPNVSSLPPGQILDIFSFDHDLGQFVSIGTGTVSEDGSVITSDPGVGIRKAGWGYPQPPPDPETCVDACGVCKRCNTNQGVCVENFNPATTCCDTQFGTRPKHPIEDLATCPNRVQKFPPREPNGCTGLPGDGQIIPIISVSGACIVSSFGLFTPDCNIHDQCYDTCSRSKGSCDIELFSNWETSCTTIDNFICRTNCNLNAEVFELVVKGAGFLGFYDRAQKDVCQCCP